jgi:tetratricopeptide (TPR) repeat protein
MDLKLKTISQSGIPEALSKAQLYRNLNEPEEAESICHDILLADPENQAAIRLLGLALTDQFTGESHDRYTEAETAFSKISDAHDREYCTGLYLERRAKAQIRARVPAQVWIGLLHEAMLHFESAERIRPVGNDDALLRWNRCVRILQTAPHVVPGDTEEPLVVDYDLSPAPARRSARAAR